jgi:starch phosphorylase
LYNVLENEVIPCFYERKNGEAPVRWIHKMRHSMKMAISQFSAHRMVKDYQTQFYAPALENYRAFTADERQKAKDMVGQRHRLLALWEHIRVNSPVREKDGPSRVGESFQVTADVFLGKLQPEEVCVELYYGSLKSIDTVSASRTEPMTVVEDLGEGNYRYGCAYQCKEAGRFGFTVRVTPEGDAHLKYMPGFISWA